MELFSRGKARNKTSLLPEPHPQQQHVTPSIRSHSLPSSMSTDSPNSPGGDSSSSRSLPDDSRPLSTVRPSDKEVEELFEKMLTRRGIHDLGARSVMLSFPTDKKWLMVSQDKQVDATPTVRPTISISASSRKAASESKELDKGTPEYYIKQFLEPDFRGINPKILAHLAVSLRTMPLSWVRTFIEARGLQVITNVLGNLNKRQIKRETDLQMEIEIIKCFKSLLNNRWGAREVVMNPQCIYNCMQSLLSPPIQTRKLVCEVLVFMCYCEVPSGQEIVLRGLEQLRNTTRDFGRFDPWFKLLETTIDGRGRMGSLVGASDDFRRLGMQGTADNHLNEYTISNLMLINSIISVVEDVDIRVHLRNQMNACGLQRILAKMAEFNNTQVTRHINNFHHMADNDNEEIMEIYNEQMINNMSDPRDVFECILSSVEGTRSYDFFLSAMQHLLLIKDSVEDRARYFQLIDKVVTQIVLERKGLAEDVSSGYGMSVVELVEKFTEKDQVQKALQEAKEAKDLYEQTVKEKKKLELELSLKGDSVVSQLKAKTSSLEDLLRVSRHTISILQARLRETQQEYQESLAKMDERLRMFHQAVMDANPNSEANEPGNRASSFVMTREELIRAYDRLRAQDRLEGQDFDKENGVGGSILSQLQTQSQPTHTAVGLSDEFKQSLTRQLHSSIPGTFVVPGTAPLIGSTRRGRSFEKRGSKDTGEEGSERAEGKGTAYRKEVGRIPVELKEQVQTLLAKGDPQVENDKSDTRPTNGLAAALQQKLIEKGPQNLESDSVVTTSDTTQQTIETCVSLPPPPPPPPPMPSALPGVNAASHGTIPPPPPPPMPQAMQPSVSATTTQSIPPSPPPPPPRMPGTAAAANAPPPPPPPPLPGMSGALNAPPPPPPPPPGSADLSFAPIAPVAPTANVRKVMIHQSKVKTKALQWTKMNQNNVSKTVWGSKAMDEIALEMELKEKGVFDGVEELFAQKVFEPKKIIKREKKPQVCIIDSKKAYNINIALLAKLKRTPFEEVRKRILAVDFDFCTEILLRNMVGLAPTPDEMGKLSVFASSAGEEDLESLSPADRFCLEMMKIDRYKERIQNMLFMRIFPDKQTQLSENMQSVLNASTDLKNSAAFQELLNLILMLGNFLNGSGYQGGAFGIKISSINKLVDTKGSKDNTTLLHFLVDVVESKFPRIYNFLDDLKSTDAACKVTLIDLIKEYNELRSGLQVILEEIERHQSDEREPVPDDQYYKFVSQFQEEAVPKFDELEVRYTAMDIAYKDVVTFFGENASEMKPDEFFGIFKTFTSSWEKAMSDNVNAKKKLEQIEKTRQIEKKRKERISERKKTKGIDISEAAATGKEDDKYLMDNLLDKLRSGDLDTGSRRRGDRSGRRRDPSKLPRSESVSKLAEDLLKDIQSEGQDKSESLEKPASITLETASG